MFQVEESSFDVLEEEFAADTNSENILHTQEDSINLLTINDSKETNLYPAMSFPIDHESYYTHDEVVIIPSDAAFRRKNITPNNR